MSVSHSEFYMWRAVFAMAHADQVVTSHESRFMHEVLQSVDFSDEQRRMLELDMKEPRDVGEMFMQITDPKDRSAFFYNARLLCWCDGDFDEQEQKIMLALNKTHVESVNFDKVLADVDLQLEEEDKEVLTQTRSALPQEEPQEGKFRAFFKHLGVKG